MEEKMSDIKILKTEEYNKFKFHLSNRKINATSLKNLVESMDKEFLLHINPIIVDKDYYIIDGQHRLEACKKLRKPVYYTVINPDLESRQVMISLNKTQRSWDIENYINFFKENSMVKVILSAKEKFSLPYRSLLQSFFKNKKNVSWSHYLCNTEEMEWKRSIGETLRFLDFMEDLKELIPRSPSKKTFFINAPFCKVVEKLFFHPEIDLDRLKKVVVTKHGHFTMLKKHLDIYNYVLQEYNYRVSPNNRLKGV